MHECCLHCTRADGSRPTHSPAKATVVLESLVKGGEEAAEEGLAVAVVVVVAKVHETKHGKQELNDHEQDRCQQQRPIRPQHRLEHNLQLCRAKGKTKR